MRKNNTWHSKYKTNYRLAALTRQAYNKFLALSKWSVEGHSVYSHSLDNITYTQHPINKSDYLNYSTPVVCALLN